MLGHSNQQDQEARARKWQCEEKPAGALTPEKKNACSYINKSMGIRQSPCDSRSAVLSRRGNLILSAGFLDSSDFLSREDSQIRVIARHTKSPRGVEVE